MQVMTLVERLDADLKAAMKAQDQARTSALRMAKAALKNREIDLKAPLDDAEALRVLQALVKQREDSIFQFRKANRPELVAKEQAEHDVLKAYLPEEVAESDVEKAVEEAVKETGALGPKDIGKATKSALARLQATGKRVDGKKVNDAVRRRLGA
jgi:hypothetical protein